MVNFLDLVIVVLAVDQRERRAQRTPLRPARLQNQRLHLSLALSDPFQIIIQQQYLAGLELLDGVQPAEVDEGLAYEDDESHAVRRGDEFGAQFDDLAVDEHFGLLQQQF